MKKVLYISSLGAALLAYQASAIEIPAPDSPKPKEIAKNEADDAPKVKAKVMPVADEIAWLGVGGDPIDELLSKHLKIEKGLALNSVVPDSPASEGGLQKDDIILQFGDDAIASQEDLRKSIQNKKPGQEVETTFLRGGKEMKQKFKLGARPQRFNLPGNNRPGIQIFPGGNLQQLEGQLMQNLQLKEQDMKQLLEMLQKQPMPGGRVIPVPGNQQRLQFKFNGRNGEGMMKQMMSDDNGSIELEKNEEGQMLTAKDKEGNLLFEGPMNNEDDKLLIPDEIRERAERLEKRMQRMDGNQFKFKVR